MFILGTTLLILLSSICLKSIHFNVCYYRITAMSYLVNISDTYFNFDSKLHKIYDIIIFL